jgi:hypothetical protein
LVKAAEEQIQRTEDLLHQDEERLELAKRGFEMVQAKAEELGIKRPR